MSEHSNIANVITSSIGLAAVVIHHCWYYPQEIAIYRGKSSNIVPGIAPVAFVLLRYAGILALVTSLLFATIKTEHCRAMITANQVGSILTIACSGFLFLLSAIRKWQGNQVISTILGILYVGMIVCSCVGAAQFQLRSIPSGEHHSELCHLLPLPSLTALGYGASLLFGMAILLCFCPMVSKQPARQRTQYTAIVCVGIATATNLAWLITHALGKQTQDAKLAVSPFGTAVLVLAGVHVAFSTREEEPTLPIVARPLNSLAALQVGRQPAIFVSPPTPSVPTYAIDLPAGGKRPDTPFSSYDYDSDNDESPGGPKNPKAAYITREVVITVE